MSNLPRVSDIYRHFKGNLYQIVAIAEHTETGEQTASEGITVSSEYARIEYIGVESYTRIQFHISDIPVIVIDVYGIILGSSRKTAAAHHQNH